MEFEVVYVMEENVDEVLKMKVRVVIGCKIVDVIVFGFVVVGFGFVWVNVVVVVWMKGLLV